VQGQPQGPQRIARLLASAVATGRRRLDESASLDLLDACGIPTVGRRRVEASLGPEGAAAAADALGYPVALKGLAPGTVHRTEAGLVRLRLGERASVLGAAGEMAGAGAIEAFLVERWIEPVRELAAGLVRDASFGPSVMVGFGGIHAELVADRVFGVAPVTPAEARSMLGELRTGPMLGAYRGALAADIDAIAAVIVALGELGLAHPAVSEVDVNPLVVTHGGSCVAVDALVVLG
jgi:succinyl-CoA synthetase beta subunit